MIKLFITGVLLLGLAGTVSDAEIPESSGQEQVRVQGYVTYEMKRLHMTDWLVLMKVLPQEEIGTGLAGWSQLLRIDGKVGRILVCRGKDYPEIKVPAALYTEQRNTVVHELVHLLIRYSVDKDTDVDVRRNEEVTEQIANALVPLK